MGVEILDTLGLKCPQPLHKLALKVADMNRGDILEVFGDCPRFEDHIRMWCDRVGKLILSVRDDGAERRWIKIQL
jgi:tRNA 2-thiouridine synthesizing protein A